MQSFSISVLEKKREEINRLVFEISHSSLHDVRQANELSVTENKMAIDYIEKYQQGLITFSTAEELLQTQYATLLRSYMQLQSSSAKLYTIIERKKEQKNA